MKKTGKRLFSPPNKGSLSTEQQILILRVSSASTLLIGLLLGLANVRAGFTILGFSLFLLSGVSIYTLWSIRHGRSIVPSFLLPFSALLVVTSNFIMGGGILQEPGVLIYPVVILFASLLLGKWAALIFAVLSVLSEVLVFYLATFGLFPNVEVDGKGVSGLIVIVLLIAITAGLLWVVLDSLERSVERAQSSEARWRSLAKNAPVTIVNVDRNGIIRFVNHLGRVDVNDVIGKPLLDFSTIVDYKRAIVISRRVLKSGESAHFETYVRNPENQDAYYAISVGPVIGRDGEVEGLTYIILDITEKKRSEDEIRRLNKELELLVHERTTQLEISNQELASLSYSVSHDLRTPLRAIDGFSLALMEDYSFNLDDQGRDFLKRVRAASQRMGILIDDLLRLASIARQEFYNQEVDLSALATSITKRLAANENTPRIIFVVQPDLKACGDENLLRVALEELFENACIFSRENDSAQVEFGSQNIGNQMTYFVRDNGIGFDMEYGSKLFQPFQHLHGRSDLEGSGVGLAIVQRVIQKHGGKVWAEAQVGQGATFYFTLSSG